MERLELIKIKSWIFDPLKKTLTNKKSDGQVIVETLEAKHADLLCCLINHQNDIVSRDKLIELVWKSRFVDDRTINATISRLRKVLGGEKDEFIKTHPKLGYSFPAPVEYMARPTPKKIKRVNKNKSNIKLYKYGIVASVLSFSFFIWFTLTEISNPSIVLTKDSVDIEPLTYEEGWEFEPSLSFDDKYLAYTTTNNSSKFLSLKVKNLDTGESTSFLNNFYTRTPTWSPANNDLFYAIEREGQCIIEKVTMKSSLKFDEPLQIASCGNDFFSPTIAISNDGLWLYFSFKNNNSSSRVKRLNLKSKKTEMLTSPSDFANDYEVSINKDNTKLAFIRFYENHQSKVFVLDIRTKQVIPVTSDYQQPFYISWLPTQNKLAVIDFINNTLNINSIESTDSYPIFKYSEQIESPIFSKNNELILALGDSYNSDIVKTPVNPSQENVKATPFIESSFKDHEIQLTRVNGIDIAYFVSNRSGGYQVWQKVGNKYKQLTKFQDKLVEITNLSLSTDSSKLLFKLNKKLHVINLNSLHVSPVLTPSSHLGNATWSCTNPDNLLVTAAVNERWGLYAINVKSGSAFLKKSDVIAIENICKNNSYALVKENVLGLFLTNLDFELGKSESIQTNHNFSNTSNWDINEKHLVFYDRDSSELLVLDLTNYSQTRLEFAQYIVHRPRVINDDIFFNGLTVKNTFIGKIPMPKLD